MPAIARADVSDADRATARTLALEGQDALDRRDYVTALDRFSRADAILHAPTLLIGVARAQVGLGRLIQAQESYNRILREGIPADAPEAFTLAVEEARRELTELGPRIPAVTIAVKGAASPEVTIDGAPVPAAALGVRRPVDPGVRVIRATAPGFAPAEVKVTLAESAHQDVTLELTPIAATPTAPTPVVVAPTPERGTSSTRMTLGIVSLGVGGAGLILGGVTGALAIARHGELSDACPNGVCPPDQEDNLGSYRTMGTLSTVGFAVGGVGLAAGAILILTAPRATPKEAPRGAWVAPRLGLGYVGAEGRF